MKSLMLALSLAMTPAFAEDWNVNGKDYRNVKVTVTSDDSVAVTYDGGIGHFQLADLSPDLQKRFNYDPAKAKAALARKEEDAKPDWQKIDDEPLKDWVVKTKNALDVAVTPDQKIYAQRMQGSLSIMHAILGLASGTLILSDGAEDADTKKTFAEMRDAGRLISKMSPDQVQNIVDNYMEQSVCRGMPKRLAILAWGPPEHIAYNDSGAGVVETIFYHNYASSITIADGVVVDVTQSK